ncbi:MAG: sigma-70 family RNA polymerase sigma factor [Clostridia bacterium]|nr:sigma-70 family RNA polymerase sigma factor [Clostridia bacterium]
MDNGASSYRRFLAGDDEGLADIIRTYRDGLIFYLNGFVNDIHTAEDLAEDVLVKLAVKKPAFREKSSFKTWLYAIGRNEACTYFRRHKITYVPLEDVPAQAAVGDAPEIGYFRNEKSRALHMCLAGLKSEYHQVLWLYYFDELPAKEIAVVMKKSVHNVETLLYRARKAARSALEAEGLNDENL